MEYSKERMELIRECLTNKDAIGVKTLILQDKFADESHFWELIGLLGEQVNEENQDKVPGLVDVCERCMTYIINIGNVKELLLALLEQADSFDDVVRFQTFLQLIQKALLKLDRKRQFSLELALETLSECIKNLELPNNLDHGEEERRAQDIDPDTEKMTRFVTLYSDFLLPFVGEVSKQQIASFEGANAQRQCNYLTKCLLKILEHPLVHLDLTLRVSKDGQIIKSNSRVCAERLISLLQSMHPSLVKLIEDSEKYNKHLERKLSMNPDYSDGEDQVPIPVVAVSCLVYLLHCEQLAELDYCCIYTKLGILELNIQFALALMVQGASEVQRKGVALFERLISGVNESSTLTYDDLDRPDYFQILDAMFDIMIYCPVKDLRQQCVPLVTQFALLFNLEARYQIFVKLFSTLKHAGAYGLCVQLFKNQMEEAITDSLTGAHNSDQFFHLNLKRILLLITSLPKGAATDFVDQSDRIVSVLNFIRYIVLRDPPKTNLTKFWDFYAAVEKEFLQPLQFGLDMAQGHYRVELLGLEERRNENQSVHDDEEDISVSVPGYTLPKMDREQKLGVLRQALNTLDLVKSLLVRVNELVEHQKKV